MSSGVRTMGTCGPCIAPQECERHKTLFLKLAEESKTALTTLGASLNDRIADLEQQSDDLQETNRELKEQSDELQKEKTQLAEQVDKLEASLREKREQLWDTIQDFRDEIKEKKKELQEGEDRQAEYRRMESLLREEVGSLQREVREQKESVSQAMRVLNEKDKVAAEAQTRLQETVEQLERRMRIKDAAIASLQQITLDQKTSFSQATRRFNEKTDKATKKNVRLKEKVAQLERRLEAESKAFEREREQLVQEVDKYRNDAQMQKEISCQNDTQEKLNLSLDNAMPQLRSLLSAYDRLRGNQQGKAAQGKTEAAVTKLGRAADQDMLQRLKEQEQAFDQERAQLLEQASDAAKTQLDVVQQSLMEREGLLTCPISLELFEFPVLTGCCGKTFSAKALRQAVNQSPLCPFCRGQLASTNANRDMTKLVELHRRERSVLGVDSRQPSYRHFANHNVNYKSNSKTKCETDCRANYCSKLYQ
ncbi:hypothetical protein PF005_g12306 [Phytophthora fragariae]|uniref:SP-RING-type domain-containing protein n=2 Tax=Phytophthora fragariae TaxID=53985 RepID=A0A6A3XTY3_9STRA|nr:hypothetical protein PF011_g13125 [Phytophthora fragariae]KAE9208202.1 hypothetical protein PF005_g12295 [Phytophthora fragariae]KAE9208207.1 hypothetical protein PF005_g12306 [Phytophthora fragariae]